MATRSETARRKTALADEIRTAVRAGQLRPGDALPPLHQLAERHRLAQSTVLTVLQPLIEEGLLSTVRSVGIFVMPRVVQRDAHYLFVTPSVGGAAQGRHIEPVRRGFEGRIADLGGRPVSVRSDELERLGRGVVAVAGVFSWVTAWAAGPIIEPAVPRVHYGAASMHDPDRPAVDSVGFDNRAAGREATEYLVRSGHREIGFLGVHAAGQPSARWSREREAGWSEVMASVNPGGRSLAYHVRRESPPSLSARERAAMAAERMLADLSRFTAVVGADDRALLGLMDALRANRIPPDAWPAMVGFDPVPETEGLQNSILTSVRMEWEELGRAAADLLSDRSSGRLTGAAVRRLVPARVIPRLSCVPGWTSTEDLAELLTTSA